MRSVLLIAVNCDLATDLLKDTRILIRATKIFGIDTYFGITEEIERAVTPCGLADILTSSTAHSACTTAFEGTCTSNFIFCQQPVFKESITVSRPGSQVSYRPSGSGRGSEAPLYLTFPLKTNETYQLVFDDGRFLTADQRDPLNVATANFFPSSFKELKLVDAMYFYTANFVIPIIAQGQLPNCQGFAFFRTLYMKEGMSMYGVKLYPNDQRVRIIPNSMLLLPLKYFAVVGSVEGALQISFTDGPERCQSCNLVSVTFSGYDASIDVNIFNRNPGSLQSLFISDGVLNQLSGNVNDMIMLNPTLSMIYLSKSSFGPQLPSFTLHIDPDARWADWCSAQIPRVFVFINLGTGVLPSALKPCSPYLEYLNIVNSDLARSIPFDLPVSVSVLNPGGGRSVKVSSELFDTTMLATSSSPTTSPTSAGTSLQSTTVTTTPGPQMLQAESSIEEDPIPNTNVNCDRGYGVTDGECQACTAGYYSNYDFCVPCPANTFNPVSASYMCQECPMGTETPSGSKVCHCQPGFARTETNMCEPCRFGYYSEGDACLACPPLQTTLSLGFALSSCICQPGSFFDETQAFNSTVCVACKEGMICPGDKEVLGDGSFKIASGFWTDGRPDFIYKCVPSENCPGGDPPTCATNRTGVACSVCEFGFQPTDTGRCLPCTIGVWLSALLLVFMFLIILSLLIWLLYKPDLTETTKFNLVVDHIAVSVFFLLVISTLPENELVGFTRNTIKGLNWWVYRVNILYIRCNWNISSTWRYGLRVFCPLFFLIIALIAWIVVMCVKRSRPDFFELINIVGMFWNIFFISIVFLSLKGFECIDGPNGSLVWKDDPALHCNHVGPVVASVLGLIFYVIPFLAACTYVTIFYHKLVLQHPSLLRKFGFLFLKFNPRLYYFGLLFVFRAFLIGLLAVCLANSPEALLFAYFFILQAWMIAQIMLQPWRLPEVNITDTVISCFLSGWVFCLIGIVDIRKSNFLPVIVAMIFVISMIMLVGLLVYYFCIFVFETKKKYSFVLSHHRQVRSDVCRVLQVMLEARSPRPVYMNTNEQSDFNSIQAAIENSETLVILFTSEYLASKVCALELYAAYKAHTRLAILDTCGFPYQEHQLRHIGSAVHLQYRAEFKSLHILEIDLVSAYCNLFTAYRLELPLNGSIANVRQAASELAVMRKRESFTSTTDGSFADSDRPVSASLPELPRQIETEVLILSAPNDSCAMAARYMLKHHLLQPDIKVVDLIADLHIDTDPQEITCVQHADVVLVVLSPSFLQDEVVAAALFYLMSSITVRRFIPIQAYGQFMLPRRIQGVELELDFTPAQIAKVQDVGLTKKDAIASLQNAYGMLFNILTMPLSVEQDRKSMEAQIEIIRSRIRRVLHNKQGYTPVPWLLAQGRMMTDKTYVLFDPDDDEHMTHNVHSGPLFP